MGIFTVLKNIVIILLLIGVVLMVSLYAEPVKNMALGVFSLQDEKVLGASSERAHEITGKVGSDLAAQAEMAKDQFLNIKFGDVFTVLLRVQQIPRDVSAVHDFVKEQAEAITSKKY